VGGVIAKLVALGQAEHARQLKALHAEYDYEGALHTLNEAARALEIAL